MKERILGDGGRYDGLGADRGTVGVYEYFLGIDGYNSYIFQREKLMSYEK